VFIVPVPATATRPTRQKERKENKKIERATFRLAKERLLLRQALLYPSGKEFYFSHFKTLICTPFKIIKIYNNQVNNQGKK
jgi:hypothetical protein